DFEKAIQEIRTELRGKTGAESQEIIKKLDPGPKFYPKFLALAEKHAKEPVAVDALFMALRTAGPGRGADSNWANAMALLTRDQAKNANVKNLVRALAGHPDQATLQFLRAVHENNPDHKVQ